MANTANTECMICTEKYNKTKRSVVTCCYCEFSACRVCCETYILDKTQPCCMNGSCNKEWSRKFLVENFSKVFINNEWKKHQEKILYDKEKALLPATQPIVEQRKRKNEILLELNGIQQEIHRLSKKASELKTQLHTINNTTNAPRERHFVRACPDGDCRGYLSSQWKCGLCKKWTCPDCHIIIGPNKNVEHECNKDDLETAKLLDRDTKPCPKCSTGIFKIEGCDQMWCTQCHTAFSWRTGHIETRIHNPHYFEFMRRSNGEAPRNQQDNNICGRDITDWAVRNSLNNLVQQKFNLKQHMKGLSYIIESVTHLSEVQTPLYRVDDQENNLELRVQYMSNEIDEDKFKKLIQQANKKHSKKRETYDILTLFQRTITEIVLRLIHSLETIEPNDRSLASDAINKHVEEIEGIRNYANECFEEISFTYSGITKTIRFYCDNASPKRYDEYGNRRRITNKDREVLINKEKPVSKKRTLEQATEPEVIIIE